MDIWMQFTFILVFSDLCQTELLAHQPEAASLYGVAARASSWLAWAACMHALAEYEEEGEAKLTNPTTTTTTTTTYSKGGNTV